MLESNNSCMMTNNKHNPPPFSMKNRIARVIWQCCYHLIFKFSPKPMHGYRSFVLRLFGAKVGRGVHVYPGVKIWAPWNLILANGCGIGDGAILYSQGQITIGVGAIISQGTHICTGTHDYTQRSHPLYTLPIKIGSNVWVAAEVFIHPGITIGEGAVIGARSVVTKDMPAWMVCAGHPCKPIKERVFQD